MSYSWGDDSGSKSVDTTSGYDYKSARKAYDDYDAPSTPKSSKKSSMKSTMGTSGSASAASAKTAKATRYTPKDFADAIGKTPPPVGKDISTTSTIPIAVCMDGTGSMSIWPGIFREKMALLGNEVAHFAPDYAISFSIFGDCFCDTYPVQVRDFDVGPALETHIKELYPEGNGGDTPENPDIMAYYYLNHCKMDKAIKPFFFLITDAPSHPNLKSSSIKKFTGDDAQATSISAESLLKKLAEKFSVYVLLKGRDAYKYYSDIFGAQKVKEIEEPRDIVDLIVACIASEMGELKDFEMRSSKRNEDKPDRVSRVMKSVKIDTEINPADAGKATKMDDATGSKSGMKSKKLV